MVIENIFEDGITNAKKRIPNLILLLWDFLGEFVGCKICNLKLVLKFLGKEVRHSPTVNNPFKTTTNYLYR